MIFKAQIPPHLSIEKVWENAAPTAAMAAQTISIPNIGDYSAIALVFRFSATVALYSCQTLINPLYIDSVVPVSNNAWNGTVTDNSNVAPLRICRYSSTICGSRNIRWFKDGIILDTGYWNSTTNTSAIIITEIYGIKFPEQSIDETMMSSSSLDILKNSLYNYTGTSSLTTDADGNFELALLTSGTLRMHPDFEGLSGDDSRYDIMLLGGGGGGGAGTGGGGGGGAGFVECYYNVELPTGVNIAAVIGAGGTGATGNNAGTNGSDTSLEVTTDYNMSYEYFDWRDDLTGTDEIDDSSTVVYNAQGGYGGGANGGYGGAGFSGGGKGNNVTPAAGGISGIRGQDAQDVDSNATGQSGKGYTTLGDHTKLETGWIGTAWHEYGPFIGGSSHLAGGGGGSRARGGCSGDNWTSTGLAASGTAGASAAANTGCGGGGGGGNATTAAYKGGNGGSGIILIRNHRPFEPFEMPRILYTTNDPTGDIIAPYVYNSNYLYYKHTKATETYTWEALEDCIVDIFGVGGGGAGHTSYRESSSNHHASGGAGGGYVSNVYNIELTTGDVLSCNVGAGGVVNTGTANGTYGGTTTVLLNDAQILYAAGGGCGYSNQGGKGGSGGGGRHASGTGGAGGSNGGNGKKGYSAGGAGAGVTTYMFGDKTIDGIAYGAGGGGGAASTGGKGGATGGGKGGTSSAAAGAGTDGTGGGGGGGGDSDSSRRAGGKGGTGCVIIRLHRK